MSYYVVKKIHDMTCFFIALRGIITTDLKKFWDDYIIVATYIINLEGKEL